MFKMFDQPPHNMATRKKFFGLSEETTPLPEEQSKLFQNIDGILKQCGGGLAPQVTVTVMQPKGNEFAPVDAYTIKRPGPGQSR